MCGLIGFLQPSPDSLSLSRRALAALQHRGPDATGEWCEGQVFLGHQRLSIIDLHTGQQPMHSADGRLVIVFNGEIYNYRELRHDLAAHGAVFRTSSDTEVILEGYRRWGADVVERLHGMFAFIVWDRQERVALVARDRLGIKPMCWARSGDGLIIASTLEPFAHLPGFDELDPVAVRDLMTFDYIPAPRTIRKGVYKLEPGSLFEWRPGSGQPCIRRYWSPPAADGALAAPSEEELDELLGRAVMRQTVSDVPIGVFLSGGIDSSLIVALMARHSNQPLKTYSVAFADHDFDESSIAAQVAQHFGTDHSVLPAEDVDAGSLQRLIGALDEPLCDPTLVPLHALSRWTREHVKVTLCGDGGDEVFGGYTKYLAANADAPMPLSGFVRRSLELLPWRPRGAAHLYGRTLTAEERLRFSLVTYGDFPVFRKDLGQLLARDVHEEARISEFFEPWERVGRQWGSTPARGDYLMRTDLQTYLSENCLVKTDRASMLASLEVRVPFLDELLLDRILPLHARQKIIDGQLKALLLPLARRLLPAAVWNRPKHGFNVPLERKLAGAWRPAVEDALEWGEQHFPMFNYSYLRRLQRISVTEGVVSLELWNPMVLLTWAMSQPERSAA